MQYIPGIRYRAVQPRGKERSLYHLSVLDAKTPLSSRHRFDLLPFDAPPLYHHGTNHCIPVSKLLNHRNGLGANSQESEANATDT